MPMFYRAYGLPILTGCAIVLVQTMPATALTALQIQQITERSLVQIEGASRGSGVIIAQRDGTHYVLTAKHVLGASGTYTVVTGSGDRYLIDPAAVNRLPGVDLAILTFRSSRAYPAMPLANYPITSQFQNVFVSGWVANPQLPGSRIRRFTAGVLGNRDFALALTQDGRREGYSLFYSNLTEPGMSGGPVVDTDGRLIGIHGRADGEAIASPQGNVIQVKRGFSSGIPIATLLPHLEAIPVTLITTPPVPLTAADAASIQPFLTPTQTTATTAAEWTNRGNQLYRLGELQAALDALNRAIQLQPDFHLAWYERGNVLFAMKLPMEALESYDRVIQLQPNFYSVWRERAVLLSTLDQPLAALGSFDRATELNPNDPVLWYMRGNLLNREFQNYGQAIAAYDQALSLKPDFADAWMGKGRALQDLAQYTAALAAYDQALRFDPNLVVAWILRGDTWQRLGQRTEAIAAYNRALQLRPNDPEVLRRLATLRN